MDHGTGSGRHQQGQRQQPEVRKDEKDEAPATGAAGQAEPLPGGPPRPAVRLSRLPPRPNGGSAEAPLEFEETSSITRIYTRTVTSSSTSTSEQVVEESDSGASASQQVVDTAGTDTAEKPASDSPPDSPHRMLHKIAVLEKVLTAEGASKRSPEETTDELRRQLAALEDDDAHMATDDNPFAIDVFDIERRLREERRRGLAEVEQTWKTFQSSPLRCTPPPESARARSEEHHGSPFNVTLRTTSRLGSESGRTDSDDPMSTPPASPFNVTLRTTRRNDKKDTPTGSTESPHSPFNVTLRPTTPRSFVYDPKNATHRFLESEKTVREVPTQDGVRTIVTSSMTSDGRSHEEKIYRHGEGYVSPRCSPQRDYSALQAMEERQRREDSMSRSSGGRCSATPPRSIDMTAGGPRIVIKLEEETELTFTLGKSTDETDSELIGTGRSSREDAPIAMATPANIDITVGSNPWRRHHYGQPYDYYDQTDMGEVSEHHIRGVVETKQEWQKEQEQEQKQVVEAEEEFASHADVMPWQRTTTTITRQFGNPTEVEWRLSQPHSPSSAKDIQTQSSSSNRTASEEVVSEESQVFTSTKIIATTTTTSTRLEERPTDYGRGDASVESPYATFVSSANVVNATPPFNPSTSQGVLKKVRLFEEHDPAGVHPIGPSGRYVLADIDRSTPSRSQSRSPAPLHNLRVSPGAPPGASVFTNPLEGGASASRSGGSASASASGSGSGGSGRPRTPQTPKTYQTGGAFARGLSNNQTPVQQSAASQDEYQEFQTTMAAINYARSNSQYDTHIREKRGNSFQDSSQPLQPHPSPYQHPCASSCTEDCHRQQPIRPCQPPIRYGNGHCGTFCPKCFCPYAKSTHVLWKNPKKNWPN